MSQILDSLQSYISRIGISDVIDILIMSFLVYKIIEFIKTTRAIQLAKGIIILIAAWAVSKWLHFYAVNWVLEKVLGVGLVALIVVFQPELRRALEFLGRGKLPIGNFGADKDVATANADVISRAVDYFSSTKTGALIVIERETALSDIADTGTLLDAKITEELIENLFYEGSPLHDGGVIIRGDRILSAGCVFPLTENPNLSKDLGTRHRAGIGISEVSDAIVLIVSEETGIISMAADGKLSRFLDLKTVEKTLLAYYMERDNRRKQSIFERLGMKGGSKNEEK